MIQIETVNNYMDESGIELGIHDNEIFLKDNPILKRKYDNYFNDIKMNYGSEDLHNCNVKRCEIGVCLTDIKSVLKTDLKYFDVKSITLIPLEAVGYIHNTVTYFDKKDEVPEMLGIIQFIETDEYYFNFMRCGDTLKIIRFPNYLL